MVPVWFLLALASAVLSATSAVTEKKVLFRAEVLPFCFLSAVVSFAASLPLLPQVSWQLSAAAWGVIFLKSFLQALSYFLIMKGIQRLEISGALPLMVVTPALVLGLEVVFRDQSVTAPQWLGLVLILGGTYLLQLRVGEGVLAPLGVLLRSRGHHFMLAAIGVVTLQSYLDKVVLSGYRVPPQSFLVFQQAFLVILFALPLPWVSGLRGKLACTWRESRHWLLLLGGLTVGQRLLHLMAVKSAPAGLVLAIKRVSVFFAAVGGGTLFREHALLRKSIAAAVMVTGAILIAI